MFYLVYLAIFGVSFYGIVYTVASFEGDTFSGVSLSGGVKKFISGYMIFSALMFSMIWISSIIPLMQTGTKPEFAWSIYIIDLCFTLPLLVIVAVMALRNSKFGIAMMLPLNIVGFSILAPLVLGEILKPTLYGLEMIVEETLMYAGISSIFLISVILLLRNLKINSN